MFAACGNPEYDKFTSEGCSDFKVAVYSGDDKDRWDDDWYVESDGLNGATGRSATAPTYDNTRIIANCLLHKVIAYIGHVA